MLFEADTIDGLSNENARVFRRNCNCLPACTSITFDLDIDRTKFDWADAVRRTHNLSIETISMYFFHT